MKRVELKEILNEISEKSRRLYRQYPALHRDLMIWEDYLQRIEYYRQKKYRACKNKARYDIMDFYSICDKTFYAIRRVLRELCEDVE